QGVVRGTAETCCTISYTTGVEHSSVGSAGTPSKRFVRRPRWPALGRAEGVGTKAGSGASRGPGGRPTTHPPHQALYVLAEHPGSLKPQGGAHWNGLSSAEGP